MMFYSTDRKTSKLFKGQFVGFGSKGKPGRMCDSVRLKWGHTKAQGSWMTFFLSFFLGWRKMKKTRISSWKSTQGTGFFLGLEFCNACIIEVVQSSLWTPTLPIAKILNAKNARAWVSIHSFHIKCIIETHCNRKNQNSGSRFGANS